MKATLTAALLALASAAQSAPILTPSTTTYGGIVNATHFVTGGNTFILGTNNWPATQNPPKAVDGIIGPNSKYLNLHVTDTALLFSGTTARVASRLELWVAEDEVNRDPASYTLYGTDTAIPANQGTTGNTFALSNFTQLSTGTLALPDTRDNVEDATGFSQVVPIPNTTAYASYLLVFPTVKNAPTAANSMQISEVQLYDSGIIGVEQFDYPDGPIADKNGGTFWNWKNQTPAGRTITGPSDWNGSPTVANGRLTTNNSSAEREYNGPGEGLPIETDEGLGAISAFNNGTLSFLHKTVYYRVTLTTGATLPDSLSLISSDFGTDSVAIGKLSGAGGNFAIRDIRDSNATTATGPAVAANTTYTLVAKLDFGNGATGTASLFLNPDLNAPEPSPLVSRSFNSTFWSSRLKLSSGTGGSAVTWDDLVVATAWDDLGTVVTTLDDEDDLTLGGGTGVSLREAVKYSPTGSLITFRPDLSGETITLTHADGDMEIPGAVTIDASALPGGLTVSGNNTSRHFFVQAGKSLTLRGLTLMGGNGTGSGQIDGGSIFNFGTLTLDRCTLSGNMASNGGAVFQQGATTTLSHCTVVGNRSTGGGSAGGILALSGTLNLQHCTISQNTGNGLGGGLFVQSPAIVNVTTSIIAGNTDNGSNRADIFYGDGTLNPTGTNLIGSNESVETQFPPVANLVGTAAAPVNPKLSPLGSFGGPVQTMHPLIGSPAIDAAGATNPGGTDARGFPRFVNGDNASPGDQLDIGAVEAGRLLTVAIAGDANVAGNFRSLMASAPSFGKGTRLTLSTGISSTIALTQGQLTPPAADNALFIDASNLPNGLTLDGGGNSRVFNIPATATVAMHSLKIVGGKADGASGGGGILNAGTCTLMSSTLSGNSATQGVGIDGGGIFNTGTCTVLSSTLSGNSAVAGGGIYNNGTCTVMSSTLSGNSAFSGGGSGGGIRNDGTCTVLSSTLSGNSATQGVGGGIRNIGTCTVLSSTLSGNSAGGGVGGGILNTGTFSLASSIVAGNTAPTGPDIQGFVAPGPNNLLGPANPLLAPLGDYGGPTQTMPPLPGSPALDAAGPVSEVQQVDIGAFPVTFTLTFNGATTASLNQSSTAAQVQSALTALPTIGVGNVTVTQSSSGLSTIFTVTFTGTLAGRNQSQITASNGLAATTVQDGHPGNLSLTDQRGLPRSRDGDGNGIALPDIGAVESGLFAVTNTTDAAAGSLRQAVLEAAAQPGPDTVYFTAAVTGPITLTSEILITDPTGGVTIDASNRPAGQTISGSVGTPTRLFQVQAGVSLTLRGLTLTGGNSGFGDGGAVFSAGTLLVDRCTFFQNTCNANGGAIGSTGTLTGTHSTFTGNTSTRSAATFGGGAISCSGPTMLAHCTFADNAAVSLGGAILQSTNTLTLENTLVAGNTASLGPDLTRTGGSLTTTSVNFIGNLAHSTLTAGPTVLTGDPKLSPLGSYGGPTQTMPPLAGSPAIDAAGATSAFTTDQRGRARVVDGNNAAGPQTDIGAVESAFRFVTNNGDSGPGSLRQAVLDAAAAPGWEAIAFVSTLNAGTISLTSTHPGNARTGIVITDTDGVAIDASSLSGGLTITKPPGDWRLFWVDFGKRLSLHQLTLTGGSVTGSGGAVHNFQGTLSLSDCTLTGNTATDGGAIWSNSGSIASGHFAEVRRCTLTGNTATGRGGAIRNEGGKTTVLFSTISGNTAPGTSGGGIASWGDTITLTEVTSSIVSGNPGGDVVLTNGATNSFLSRGHNLIGTGNGNPVFTQTGDINNNADPLLAPLADYGGPTQTMALRPTSPARNTGSPTARPTDQRGFPMIGVPDKGAYEAGNALLTNYNAFIWETLPATATAPQTATTFDFDSDGLNNLAEWTALTDPGNSASYFEATHSWSGATLTLSYQSKTGRNYQRQTSPNMTTWTNFSTPFTGNDTVVNWVPTITGLTRQFYRVQPIIPMVGP